MLVCSFPPFESTPPPYLRTANISESPFRRLFAGFSCLGDPPPQKKKKKKKKKKKIRNTAKWTTPPPNFRWALVDRGGTGGQCFYFSKWNNPEWAFKASRNFRNLIPGFDQFFYDIQIYYITPFLHFSGVRREREKKPHPLFKEISGWKVKYTPFFYNSRAGFCRAKKYPFPGDFRNAHAVPPTPECVCGGGGVDEDWSSRPGVFKTYSGRLSLQLFQGKPVHILIICIFEKGFGWGN